jgi:hypothetical protein
VTGQEFEEKATVGLGRCDRPRGLLEGVIARDLATSLVRLKEGDVAGYGDRIELADRDRIARSRGRAPRGSRPRAPEREPARACCQARAALHRRREARRAGERCRRAEHARCRPDHGLRDDVGCVVDSRRPQFPFLTVRRTADRIDRLRRPFHALVADCIRNLAYSAPAVGGAKVALVEGIS